MTAPRRITWLHVSDFHVGMDGYGQRKLFSQIIDYVGRQVENGYVFDFIFVTGDIANKGWNQEYLDFLESFLVPLVDKLGSTWDGRIFAVPGNHDVDRRRNPWFAPSDILARNSPLFDPTAEGMLQRQQLLPRFEEYINGDLSVSPRDWLKSESGAYSTLSDIYGAKVAVVGINTAWLSKGDNDRHLLTPGSDILEDALNRYPSAHLKIVLAHHPLDWLSDPEAARIRTILARHHALYLHGHMHENDAHYEDAGGTNAFLSLRCGAAFQGRAEDIPGWVNGFQRVELDLDKRELLVQALHWSPLHREWKINTDAFPNDRRSEIPDWWCFPTPGSSSSKATPAADRRLSRPATQKPAPPAGWALVDIEFLSQRIGHDTSEKMLHYLDGTPPDWSLAVSNGVSRRQIVSNLLRRFQLGTDELKPSVVVLLGAGGEGKSTAALQTVVDLVREHGWVALWRYNENATLSGETIQRFSRTCEKVLVFADDAHFLASELPSLIFSIKSRSLRNVHFLLCSRTIDWRAEIRDAPQIIANSLYQEISLRGVNDRDAEQIIDTWASYGKEGLGELYALPREQAVERLKEIAVGESGNSDEGVLLGAMLRVRYGDKLKDKVRSTLYRLMEVRGPKGTLLDAYAMIAVMHAEGLRFLSAPVLSEVLGCSLADLRRKVLNPLADEAVAAGGGRFILSRHRAIAEASIEVIQESNLYGDLEGLFPELAEAALRARAMGQYVPDLDKWDYQLPSYFLDSGRPLLAVSAAKVMQEADPLDIRLRVNLSKIYREVKAVDKSLQLFRGYSGTLNRVAYTEWSVAEGNAGNCAAAAVISAAAICDLPGVVPPTRDTGKAASAFATTLRRLYEQYGEKVFLNGALAIAEIGLKISNEELTRQPLIEFMMREYGVTLSGNSVHDLIEDVTTAVKRVMSFVNTEEIFHDQINVELLTSFNGLRALAHLGQRP